jgi:hypothetical protein
VNIMNDDDDETPAHGLLLTSLLHAVPAGLAATCAKCAKAETLKETNARVAWLALRSRGWSVSRSSTFGLLCDECSK